MKEFQDLLNVADRLLAPDGCPWDREQTIFSLQPYLLEEMHELLEAIDIKNFHKIVEELGDVIYALIFLAKIGEKEGKFLLSDALENVTEKLIRRHPHVFGESKLDSADEVVRKWDEIKKREGKKNPIEGIPPSLPALARAYKVVQKLRRLKHLQKIDSNLASEEDLGERLWLLVKEAESKGFDAESALRRTCISHEEKFK